MNYSTSKHFGVDGRPEIREVFELRKPEYHLEAKRHEGQDKFDVAVKYVDEKGMTVHDNK